MRPRVAPRPPPACAAIIICVHSRSQRDTQDMGKEKPSPRASTTSMNHSAAAASTANGSPHSEQRLSVHFDAS